MRFLCHWTCPVLRLCVVVNVLDPLYWLGNLLGSVSWPTNNCVVYLEQATRALEKAVVEPFGLLPLMDIDSNIAKTT